MSLLGYKTSVSLSPAAYRAYQSLPIEMVYIICVCFTIELSPLETPKLRLLCERGIPTPKSRLHVQLTLNNSSEIYKEDVTRPDAGECSI